MGLRFAVLGPVRAWRDELPVEIGSPQRQAVLAALLLRDGRPATVRELLDAVWGGGTPLTAVGRLRTVVSALRQALEPGRPARSPSRLLLSVNGGYALRLPPGALDLSVMEGYARDAENARAAGDQAIAARCLDQALALWTGEPLSGVPGPYAAAEQSRLAERRLSILEARIDVYLELRRHAEVVPELMTLTADHPLRERFRGQLMSALYRSGRQAEALEVYAETRRLLVRELGIEPGPELAAVQRRILTGPAGHAAAETPARPWQLPPDIPDFTGRGDEVRRLTERLCTGTTMAIAAVCGMGGVGKTTLAVHVAHLVRDRFPDGQLYADLNGADPKASAPEEVLGGFLRALGHLDGEIPAGEAERAALFRTTMARRRMLVVLDNARDAAQVRALLPGTPGSAVLITSRAMPAGLPGALPVALEPLTLAEARALFARALGHPGDPAGTRATADPEATDAVLAACGRLPLAVRIVAARLAARPTWKVSAIAERLRDERRRLTELRAGGLAVEATFRLGYGLLGAAQSRAFRLAATADVPELPVSAVAAILDRSEPEAEALCESLVDAGLLLCGTAPGRYRYHDLLRLFARGLADAERPAVVPRLLDFYLATAKNLIALRTPGSLLPRQLEPTTSAGLEFSDEAAVQRWLDSERPMLRGLYRQAAQDSATARRLAADLAWLVAEAFDLTDRTPEIASALHAVADAAQRAGERRTEARARLALGCLLGLTDRRTAATQLTAALALHEPLDDLDNLDNLHDPRALAWTYYGKGVCAHLSGDYSEALDRYHAAIGLLRDIGDRWGQGRVLATLAIAYGWTGDHHAAVSFAGQARDIARSLGNRAVESHACQALGISRLLDGRHAEALELFTESVRLAEAGHWRAQGGWAVGLRAVSLLSLGRTAEAAAVAEKAVRILTEAGDAHHLPDAVALRDLATALASGRTAEGSDLAEGLRQLGILTG